MERGRFLDIAAQAAPEGSVRIQLEALMEEAIYGKAEAVQALIDQWPGVAAALRLSAARSIGDGYYVGASMVGLSLLAALVLMRRKPDPASGPAKAAP